MSHDDRHDAAPPSPRRRRRVRSRPRPAISSRPRPSSAMPQDGGGVHTLHVEIASLQMSKARQEKIRDALREQIARCEAEIEHVDRQTAILRERIAQVERGELDAPAGGSSTRSLIEDAVGGFTFEY